MEMKRSSGILMPIASLPAPYGIGTMGKSARNFVDFLADARQSYWQILPAGPLSYGDSPYQSLSTFAGNPYFIDLDELIEDGLLEKSEVDSIDWGTDPGHVDYGKLYENRFDVLKKAFERGFQRDAEKVASFQAENSRWLPDYALFMALKRHFGMRPWTEWPDMEVRLHRADACEKYRAELADEVNLFIYIQYLFFKQWNAMKAYAASKKITIIGDLPIYVALDGADVWAEPQWFQLDDSNIPTDVSGVPPDAFNENGQLWGNPLYDWDKMRQDGYGWWIRRIDGALKLYDVVRFDHFRGLASYWSVPADETTAKNGKWIPGPGKHFIEAITGWFRGKSFIAEDLGYLTEDVKDLLAASGFPGMRILEFGFEGGGAAFYQPHSYVPNSICYTGTHDNHTVLGWKEAMDPKDVAEAKKYLGISGFETLNWGFIRGGMSSVSNLFIAQMQDYLGLDDEGRINTPGEPMGNWTWRMAEGAADAKLAKKIAEMAVRYERAAEEVKPEAEEKES